MMIDLRLSISLEHSTLFKKSGIHASMMSSHESLGDVYSAFDGADLFSSTFKIASIEIPKSVGGVEIVENLTKFSAWVEQLAPDFPEQAVPFMYQAGIGMYVIGKESGKIYEWDDEQGALSGQFDSLDQVLAEWLDAIA